MVRYNDFSGVKLAILLPVIDKMIRHAIKEETEFTTVVICATR